MSSWTVLQNLQYLVRSLLRLDILDVQLIFPDIRRFVAILEERIDKVILSDICQDVYVRQPGIRT